MMEQYSRATCGEEGSLRAQTAGKGDLPARRSRRIRAGSAMSGHTTGGSALGESRRLLDFARLCVWQMLRPFVVEQ